MDAFDGEPYGGALDQKLEFGEGGLAQRAERKSGGERISSQSRMRNGRDNFVDKHRMCANESKAVFIVINGTESALLRVLFREQQFELPLCPNIFVIPRNRS